MRRCLMTSVGGLTVLGLLLLGSGCGSSAHVDVRGKVLYNGQPYKLRPQEQLQITFLGGGTGADQISTAATFHEADSSFQVPGPTGQGLPPGDYKIAVDSLIYGSSAKGQDRLGEHFTPNSTPLHYTVTTAAVQHIVIDLGKGTVTKE